MGRPRSCGSVQPCRQKDKCTQFGPIGTWVEDDWEVEIVTRQDPLSTAVITGWGTSELEITATIGSSDLHVLADHGVDVYLRPKLTYRHYRHWKPLAQITGRCELEMPTRPALAGRICGLNLAVKHAGTSIGSVGWMNLYQERHVRRALGTLTPPALPPCPPAWDDQYTFEAHLTFQGYFCIKGGTYTTKLSALEWRIGSACESYLAPSPGNDSLHVSTVWTDPVDERPIDGIIEPPDCAFRYCTVCADNGDVTVQGDMAAGSGAVGLSVGFVPWPHCVHSELWENNGSFFYSMPFEWDPDIADWAIHHRGSNYLAGNSSHLSAGSLLLTAAPYRSHGGGAIAVHPDCGPVPYVCQPVGDICTHPATFTLSLATI